ncbi:MAG: hypothetical protein CR960_00200 [Pasteurellales bacterium]|nr:MAG: hypothetical protein CR960_00200 [Pasteurellales bacterium]
MNYKFLLFLTIFSPLVMAQKPLVTIINKDKQIFSYSEQDIRNDVLLATDLLNVAIMKNNISLMQKIVPVYESMLNADPILIDYAKAKIANARKDYVTAITYYRKILAVNPKLNPVRIELAQMYFLDKQA